ncbi:multidrug resistance efflux transporter family protein [Bacillus sp. DX1.1]|uniref:DMT family transporter n=1 Tax=unclassified Bacillus (in: firmicutes) TaxID=185979 RepID=UPI0025712238|nr:MULTISPECIES: multidrug resistance efflux transporter family protein [unclassified Bacillus (in: firmicutes)]MDM5156681.1 multidrug resistance efflux transporter family protein [Bacillus sp. DX1.1]WJE80936.1 multidrug resistance efflux transporter family protein [Bacillus sp. DX3.1]
MRAILLGLLSSAFFSATFIINRAMNVSGTSWAWTASFRFLFALPILFLIVLFRKNLGPLWSEMRKHPFAWLGWGPLAGIGFYSLLSFAAVFNPAWLVAGTWQITILAGLLLSPLFFITIETKTGSKRVRGKIPLRSLFVSLFILIGVICMQATAAGHITVTQFLSGFLPVVIAAFLYPFGNRKMMEVASGRLDTFQRVLGMAIGSLPIAIILAIYGWSTTGIPTSGQMLQGFLLALCSGVIATMTFFFATDLAKNNLALLGAVEATQAGTMIFTVLGEIIFLNGSFPAGLSLIGMIIIMAGMVANSILNRSVPIAKQKKTA